MIGGGYVSSASNTIDYITIPTAGNATDFGDLTRSVYTHDATSNATNERGLFAGGQEGSASNTIDYITINSAGNATDFGDLTSSRNNISATSNAGKRKV